MSCSSAVPPPYSEASIPSSLSTNCSMGTRFWSTTSGASQRNHSIFSQDSLTHGDLTILKWIVGEIKGTSKPKFCSSCVGLDPARRNYSSNPIDFSSSSSHFFQIARVFWQQIQAHRIILIEKSNLFRSLLATSCCGCTYYKTKFQFSFLFFPFLFCFALQLHFTWSCSTQSSMQDSVLSPKNWHHKTQKQEQI